MIRIDEIYSHTFWPWLKQNRPETRLYTCEPFGRSDPESVICYQGQNNSNNYIFFFDQEPIHLDMHVPTFNHIKTVNRELAVKSGYTRVKPQTKNFGYLCTSEKNSAAVDYICKQYKWTPLYYFFHGWAALDWYRGYNRTYLIKPFTERTPTKTFIAPNRIIAGKRQHRLEMLYWIFKLGLTDNHISCPTVCPAENVNIYDAVKTLPFNDAEQVFRSAPLPMQFTGETDHPMHSCWLSLFDQSADSLLYLVTETVADGRRLHLTEKTFKPIALGMPFVLVATAGSLEYLRSYGFKTFGHLWDEGYDDILDPHERIRSVASLLQTLDNLSPEARINLWKDALPTIEHNYNHFYNGGFEKILWDELQGMLNRVKSSL